MIEHECRKCKASMSHSYEYCPKCGTMRLTIRSENEVKAEIKHLGSMKVESMAANAIMAAMICALSWVLGEKILPSDLVELGDAKIMRGEK